MATFAPCNCNALTRTIIFLIFVGAQFCNIKFVYVDFFYLTGVPKIFLLISLAFWSIFSFFWIIAHIVTSWLDAGSVERCLEKRKLLHNGNLAELPEDIIRYQKCPKCNLPKSDRTHHCSECNRCYFRFDHHCPLVGNCIALRNMKAFVLFNVYSALLLILCALNIIFFTKKDKSDFHGIMWFVFAILLFFALFTSCFGLSYCTNLTTNRTTLERIAKQDPDQYNKGSVNNLKQILGESWWTWIIPIPNNIDGFKWSELQYKINTV